MRNPRTRRLLAFMLMGAGLALGTDAFAVVGRPLTPMSYAGVARRTTRRAVYAGAAVSHSYAHTTTVAPMPVPVPVPSSTVITTLPAGCTVGVPCGGVTYRAEYQGTNLVYVGS